MSWLEQLRQIEELENAPLDATLVAELERTHRRWNERPIRFATPTFKDYA